MMLFGLGLNPETKIQAGVDWYGPVDFSTMDDDMKKTGLKRESDENGLVDSAESKLI